MAREIYNHHLTFRVPKAWVPEIAKLAKADDRNVSDWLRQMLRTRLVELRVLETEAG